MERIRQTEVCAWEREKKGVEWSQEEMAKTLKRAAERGEDKEGACKQKLLHIAFFIQSLNTQHSFDKNNYHFQLNKNKTQQYLFAYDYRSRDWHSSSAG